jgi:hypothetical protein
MRWRRWIVKAKSGMSFERDTRRSRKITLSIKSGQPTKLFQERKV